MRFFLWLTLAVANLQAQTGMQPAPAGRFALVIGNGAYRLLPPIPQAGLEADAMATALRKIGFTVQLEKDIVNMPSFFAAEQRFLKTLHPGDVALIYFSGYAIRSNEESNFLTPLDFDPKSEAAMLARAFILDRIQTDLEDHQAGVKIIAIEGSRPIPVPIPGEGGKGLATPNTSASRETLIAFSTPTGQVIEARPTMGRFTRALAASLETPGARITSIFDIVKEQVGTESAGSQIPYFDSNMLNRFYFVAPLPEKKTEPEIVVKEVIVKEKMSAEERLTGFPATNKRDRQEYVYIPPGKFKMGCVPGSKCEPEERPQHEVTISKGFWLGRTEATTEALRRFLAANRSVKLPQAPEWNTKWRNSEMPVANITWVEASRFCEWAGGRLPTEAEWEYAHRAGKENEILPLNDENSRDKANFWGKQGNDVYEESAAPVKKFDPNPWGLYDMAGNVWEWVSDWFSKTYFTADPVTDPQGPPAEEAFKKQHVVRGGSWNSKAEEHLRMSYRGGWRGASNTVGFRCALPDGPETRKLLNVPDVVPARQ